MTVRLGTVFASGQRERDWRAMRVKPFAAAAVAALALTAFAACSDDDDDQEIIEEDGTIPADGTLELDITETTTATS
jgi:hypothetical protein